MTSIFPDFFALTREHRNLDTYKPSVFRGFVPPLKEGGVYVFIKAQLRGKHTYAPVLR